MKKLYVLCLTVFLFLEYSSLASAAYLKISLENKTKEVVTVTKIVKKYSYFSDGVVFESMEIEPDEKIDFSVFVFFDRFLHQLDQDELVKTKSNQKKFEATKYLRRDGIYFKIGKTEDEVMLYWDMKGSYFEPNIYPLNLAGVESSVSIEKVGESKENDTVEFFIEICKDKSKNMLNKSTSTTDEEVDPNLIKK